MSDTLYTRRRFLSRAVLGGAMAWTVPAFLERTFFTLDAAAADSSVQTATGKYHPILVVLQLAGGNDGLNTLVPYTDDAYHRARPTLRIPAERILRLDDHLGFHPSLAPFKALYDEGHLAVVQGVGYPNPNRSHFRSTEIWQTAVDANRTSTTGWLGRYFDACCKGEDPTVGISIGSQTPQAFAAKEPTGISFANPEQFRFDSKRTGDPTAAEKIFREANDGSSDEGAGASIGMLQGNGAATGGDTLDFLKRTALDVQISSDKVIEVTRRVRNAVPYPATPLANSLSVVARLIGGGMPTRVYYAGHGGYDTHNNQAGAHERLLAELANATAAFVADLKAQGNLDRVMLVTFSEFGRRVAENASGGTDHGAAAPLFVLGGNVKPGLYGQTPSLANLKDGDLVHGVDFRSVYGTVLTRWLKTAQEPVLGRAFPTLAFV